MLNHSRGLKPLKQTGRAYIPGLKLLGFTPSIPNLGQGACQALEDAAALANHIQARQIEALISYRV